MSDGLGHELRAATRYAVMPGIVPRLKQLFGGTFETLPYLVAVLFSLVRLLPKGHPYLQGANIGRYGVRHVIAAASQNIILDSRHIDQIIVFVLVLTGMVIFGLYGIGLIAYVLISPVFAAGPSQWFQTPPAIAETDIAFNMLDRVFGVPGIFNSGYSQEGNFPTAFHTAFHSLLEFYSTTMFILALVVVLYYVVVVVYETSTSGTPFGKRFDTLYAPLRLVIALGLLIPTANGLNTAQYMALYAAKFGSSLATNGWLQFNQMLENPLGATTRMVSPQPRTYTGIDGSIERVQFPDYESRGLIAPINVPAVTEPVQFMHLVRTCVMAYHQMYGVDIKPYQIRMLKEGKPLMNGNTIVPFSEVVNFAGGNDIKIRFGLQDKEKFPIEVGNVFPFCGEIQIPIHGAKSVNAAQAQTRVPGIYYQALLEMLSDQGSGGAGPRLYAQKTIGMMSCRMVNGTRDCIGMNKVDPCAGASGDILQGGGTSFANMGACNEGSPDGNLVGGGYRAYAISERQRVIDRAVYDFVSNDLEKSMESGLDQTEVRGWGWAGAGVWYNHIADNNGELVTAVISRPMVTKFPHLMEKTFMDRMSQNSDMKNMFNQLRGRDRALFNNESDPRILESLNEVHKNWQKDADAGLNQMGTVGSSNHLMRFLAFIFGIEPIMTITESDGIHPMAKLSAVGRGLIEKSILNLGLSVGASALAGFAGGDPSAAAWSGLSGLFTAIAGVGLTTGFILYYLVPFYPFMYFFFAVGAWVKTVFEALVGLPLWALAHLHIEGGGLVPSAARTGYELLLEIFLRPLMTLLGLMAAVTIFNAVIVMLNTIWGLVLDNVTGATMHDLSDPRASIMDHARGGIDPLFYTIFYAIVVYLTATSTFKLIDQIPNNMIRFLGSGSRSFADSNSTPVDQLAFYASIGGNQMFSQQLAPALPQLTQGLTGQMSKGLASPPPPPATGGGG